MLDENAALMLEYGLQTHPTIALWVESPPGEGSAAHGALCPDSCEGYLGTWNMDRP